MESLLICTPSLAAFMTKFTTIYQVWQIQTRNLRLAKLGHFVQYAIICVCSQLLVYIMNICIYFGIYTYKYIVFIDIYVYYSSYAYISDRCVQIWYKALQVSSLIFSQQNHFTHKLEAKILSSTLTKVCPVKSWEHSGLVVDMYTKFGRLHG